MFFRKIKIKRIRGLEDLEINPGAVTIIEGDNGVGKSSFIDALVYLGELSHDPSMVRNIHKGAGIGEIMIEVGDSEGGEYDGAVVHCKITPEKSERNLVHPKLGKISVAQSKKWIADIINMVSYNPVRLLTATRAEQVKYFLEALPIKLTADKLGFLPGEKVKALDLDKHALVIIGNDKSGLYGELYEDRKGKNASAKDKRATARTTAEGLPDNPPEGNWSEAYQVKTAELGKLRGDAQIQSASIRNDAKQAEDSATQLYNGQRDALNKECDSDIDKIKDALRDEIHRLEREASARIDKLLADTNIAIGIEEGCRDVALQRARDSEKEALAAAKASYDPKNETLLQEITTAKNMIEAHAKAQSTRELIMQLNGEAEKLEGESKVLTDQMKKLEALKADLLSALPIPGLEISDGELLDNGIPIHAQNDAEKWRVVFEMGKLGRGKLSAMVIDRAEVLGDANWNALLDVAGKSGMQVFFSKRTSGALQISTDGKVA